MSHRQIVIRIFIGLGTHRAGFLEQRLGFFKSGLELPGGEQAFDQQAFIFKAGVAPFRDPGRGGLPQSHGLCQSAGAVQVSQELDDKRAELDILALIGSQLENTDDHYRRLKDCHEKMLRLSREIGHRPEEARAFMYCGQIQGLYLGDYEAGLALLEESLRIREGTGGALFPLLRIVQIQVMLGRYEAAIASYDRALQLRPGWSEAGENRRIARVRFGLRLP